MYAIDKSFSWNFRVNRLAENKLDVYVYTGKLSQLKKDYVKSLYTSYNSKNVILVKHSYPKVLGKKGIVSDNSYRHVLGLNKYPKSEWRARIKDYQHVISLLTQDFINLDDLEIPEAFIESRKTAKAAIAVTSVTSSKRLKVKGEIVGKKGIALQRYVENRNCKFDSQLYKLEDLESAKHLKVYTNHADYLKLDALYAIKSKQQIEVITFSERELKIVNSLDIHNIMSFDKFMEGNNAPFKRIVTAYLIHKFIRKYESTFNKRELVSFVSTNLSERMKVLMDYRSKNYGSGTYPTSTEEELYKAMLAVAEENNLFDMNVYPELLQLQELFDKLPFLNPLFRSIGWFKEEDPMVNVVTDLFKYHRQRVNLKHYNVKLNEEVFTEEQVEELLD
jgi:hypothetical protein